MQFAVLLFADVCQFVCASHCMCVHSTCQTLCEAHPTMKALQKQGKTPTLSLRIVCSFNNVPCVQRTLVSHRREEIQLSGPWFCVWVHNGGGCLCIWLHCVLVCGVVLVIGVLVLRHETYLRLCSPESDCICPLFKH